MIIDAFITDAYIKDIIDHCTAVRRYSLKDGFVVQRIVKFKRDELAYLEEKFAMETNSDIGDCIYKLRYIDSELYISFDSDIGVELGLKYLPKIV